MRSIKIILVSLLVISMMPQMVCADDGNMFYYYTKSSTTPTKMSLDDVDKLTFSSNGVQIWSQNGINEIPFGDFMLITFSEIEHPLLTAVEPVSLSQDVHIRYMASQRTLLIESSQPLSGVGVFDLQGRVICSDASAATNYRITLPAAPKGVYVVKTVLNGKITVNKIVL